MRRYETAFPGFEMDTSDGQSHSVSYDPSLEFSIARIFHRSNFPSVILFIGCLILAASITKGANPTVAVNISVLGKIKFIGALADGQQAKQATTISKDGRWPFYAPMYRTLSQVVTNGAVVKTNREFQGSILGWLTFAANTWAGTTNPAPQGMVSWIKTGWTNALYSSGFSNTVEIAGSRHRWVAGERVIAMSEGTVNLFDGSLIEPFSANIFLNTNNALSATLPLTHQLKISQSAKSGWFKGSFIHPATIWLLPLPVRCSRITTWGVAISSARTRAVPSDCSRNT